VIDTFENFHYLRLKTSKYFDVKVFYIYRWKLNRV